MICQPGSHYMCLVRCGACGSVFQIAFRNLLLIHYQHWVSRMEGTELDKVSHHEKDWLSTNIRVTGPLIDFILTTT